MNTALLLPTKNETFVEIAQNFCYFGWLVDSITIRNGAGALML